MSESISGTADGVRPGPASGGRAWWEGRWPLARSFASRRALLLAVAGTLATLVAIDLFWSASALGIELALGDPLLAHRPAAADKNAADAIWHVASAFVIALPTRRALAWVGVPALALVFDVDHLFGGLLPTVVIRSAHDLFFLALLAVVMLAVRGPTGSLLAVGAVLEHLAVDGGGFPILAPVSTAYYGFPFPLQAGLIAIAAFLVFRAVRPWSSLRAPRVFGPFAAAVVGLAGGIDLFWPYLAPYTHT